MLYVIPFIILLVVAVVLKKRENGQKQETTSPKSINKKSGKKASGKSSKSSREKSKANVVEEVAPALPQSSPVPETVRQNILQLVQEKQFSAAEAQVNQALKKDNTQHELYLLLLEVHIAQKDEFAIQQLISHIRSLALNEIAIKAEARQKEYESSRQPDAIEFPQAKAHEEPQAISDTTAQFDQLTTSSSETSFDDLQKDYAPVKQEPAVEVEPLEFNFSFEKTATTENTSQPVDEPEVSTSQQVSEVSSSQETNELADLEFSFDLAPLHETENKTQAVEVKTDQESSINALDFNLDLNPSSSETKPAEQAPSLDEIKLVEQAPLEAASIAPLEFSLDEPALVTAPELETQNSIVVNEAVTQAQIEDPLLEAFPELKQVNENELDLKLAEQYIKFGANQAARNLLESDEQKFNTEQQQHAKNLLNRIAS
ncbi:hypothetical protein [Acinetobacter seifertii]|uniref:hypothetical protein n=1 Tax=Acinetobacter seifertii TaxID=1530123 RepID=UPI001BA63FDB|nr:hypothetical protein [Acinetobacter seifertii]